MLQKTSFLVLMFVVNILNAQYTQDEIKMNPCFIGSSAFIVMNLLPEESPDFVQLNLGYRISTKDAISLELKTWRYFEPIGIPYGKFKIDPKENFRGYIREKGFAIVYQRSIWKGVYIGLHVMNAWQDFRNENDDKVGKGFQLFNTYRLGYHLKLFKGSFFIEPSVAVTHRPYHTKMPESYKRMDERWSKFFIGEPGLHFGYNF